MKSKKISLYAATFFCTVFSYSQQAHASTVASTAEVQNLEVTFSSYASSDIYFFSGLKDSYSYAGITADNTTNSSSDYYDLGWGITTASQTIGNSSNGAVSSGSTTATNLKASASAASTGFENNIATYSSSAYSTNWISFYVYNPITINISFDYLLTELADTVLGQDYNLISQVEIKIYNQYSNNSWVLDSDASTIYSWNELTNLPSEDLWQSALVSYDYSQGQYGRIEIIAYSQAAIDQQPASVPVPGAIWLLGPGLAGLIAFRRRNAN